MSRSNLEVAEKPYTDEEYLAFEREAKEKHELIDCEKHCVYVEGRTENEVWVNNRIVLAEDLEKKYAEAKRRYSRFQ
jgi:hypothetical protein